MSAVGWTRHQLREQYLTPATIDRKSSLLGKRWGPVVGPAHLLLAGLLSVDTWSSADRTCARNDNVSFVRSFGASGGRISVDRGPEEVQGCICAGRVDVKVFVVVAHGGNVLEIMELVKLRSVGGKYTYNGDEFGSEESWADLACSKAHRRMII